MSSRPKMYNFTACGRYGKFHGEPYFRRISTLEPVQTPRRYYLTNERFLEGKRECSRAWEAWKQGKYPAANITQTPWFDFVDQNLLDINALIQSSNEKSFGEGLKELGNRVNAAKNARQNLCRSDVQKDFVAKCKDQIRRVPPILDTIYRKLQLPAFRAEARERLAKLCGNVPSSQTIKPTPFAPGSIHTQIQQHGFRRSDHLTAKPCPAHPSPSKPNNQASIHIASHRQGEEFGLGHDPGERSNATVRPGNMFAPSTAPAQPK